MQIERNKNEQGKNEKKNAKHKDEKQKTRKNINKSEPPRRVLKQQSTITPKDKIQRPRAIQKGKHIIIMFGRRGRVPQITALRRVFPHWHNRPHTK